MDYTSQPEGEKMIRAKKMMLWFGIVGLAMMFAGLTSAYIVSKERRDWLTDFELPQAFYISTAVIVLSSLTMFLAKRAIKGNAVGRAKIFLAATLLLGIVFVYMQFVGFDEIIANGYFFTGSESNITTSFIYAFVIAHITHVVAGIIVLMVMFVNTMRSKYSPDDMLGISLGSTFWHFVDVLWVYLFLFLVFFK
ncbi:heme-copper oxidase subunit III [Flavimarina sp. Hel_I_48]|uniref:cytochrome c oxidase subunit 3 n=1 Tax=Flavimarina sp. Hel_I_48 TaxID=1392488 RepID=UPI0004DF45F7|nr:cytochrome c oxidase subunit 3 [Flavimarina sp. Hel_I_48]